MKCRTVLSMEFNVKCNCAIKHTQNVSLHGILSNMFPIEPQILFSGDAMWCWISKYSIASSLFSQNLRGNKMKEFIASINGHFLKLR